LWTASKRPLQAETTSITVGSNGFWAAVSGFINGTLSLARDAQLAGDHEAALQLAAQAMHTIEDCSSPMHIDSHGNPDVWNPTDLADLLTNNLWHSPGNHWGLETPNELTQPS
jgi:hypothetical protein